MVYYFLIFVNIRDNGIELADFYYDSLEAGKKQSYQVNRLEDGIIMIKSRYDLCNQLSTSLSFFKKKDLTEEEPEKLYYIVCANEENFNDLLKSNRISAFDGGAVLDDNNKDANSYSSTSSSNYDYGSPAARDSSSSSSDVKEERRNSMTNNQTNEQEEKEKVVINETETNSNVEKEESVNHRPAHLDPNKIMEKVNNLLGVKSFKKLMEEIHKVAPFVVNNKTNDVFLSQNYLFSINDGCGIMSYLKIMAQYLNASNIAKFDIINRPFECYTLEYPTGNEAKINAVYRLFSDIGESSLSNKNICSIICIDISEWLDYVNTRDFNVFTKLVKQKLMGNVVVFKIPYVTNEVASKVMHSLSDVLFVKCVLFPPFTELELREFARGMLEHYNFTINDDAWEYFDLKIREEKSDGKFYGLETIDKVVNELIFTKQLNDALNYNNDLVVKKEDTKRLLSNVNDSNLTGMEMLNNLVSLDSVKEQLLEVISQIEYTSKNKNIDTPCIHMQFVGNPGTGKTTVARILGKILKEKGILRVGNFYEYGGRDFVGRYIGETAPKTSSMCKDAYGSILFIDEAYSLFRGESNEKDFGKEAIDTLIAEMENHRDDFLVVMAGYQSDMDTLMKANVGLKSRIPYKIVFPNYSKEALYDIYVKMIKKEFKYEEEVLTKAKSFFDSLSNDLLNSKEFSNARFVRNLYERTWAKAAMRCQLAQIDELVITASDFERAVKDNDYKQMNEKKTKYGFI